jgi:hypothetical protein
VTTTTDALAGIDYALSHAFVGDDDDDSTITDALLAVARAINRLGNADASTPLGGLEALGVSLETGATTIAEALGDLADAIRQTREAV